MATLLGIFLFTIGLPFMAPALVAAKVFKAHVTTTSAFLFSALFWGFTYLVYYSLMHPYLF